MSRSHSNKVYVGDLPATVDVEWLSNFFSEKARPTNIVIQKDRAGRPIAHAYVEFADHEAAAIVINELNYTKLDSNPIRICWFEPKQDRRANLFIKNLDQSIEVAQLHEAFSNFGEIASCKIPLTNGKSRGYGFVQFVKVEDAEQAMKDLTGAFIENKLIEISHYAPHPRKNPDQTFTNVYIKNLPDSINSDEALGALFSKFGKVQSPYLPIDPATKESRHFGYCNMETHEDAVAAVQGLNGTEIDGVQVQCNRQKNKEERKRELEALSARWKREQYQKTKDRNFYIRGFDEKTTEEDIRKAFHEFGEIESLKVVTVENTARKFGFIMFKDKADAKKAMDNCMSIRINGQSIYMSYFKPAERRQQELAQHGQTKSTVTGPGAAAMQMQGAAMQMQGGVSTIPEKPKDKLRIAILEECADQAIGDTTPFIAQLKRISDDQAATMNANQTIFINWFKQILNDN